MTATRGRGGTAKFRRRYGVTLLGVGLVLGAPGCGGEADEAVSPTTASASPKISSSSSSVSSASSASTAALPTAPSAATTSTGAEPTSPGCQTGMSAVLASVDPASGTRRWSYCSAASAWREVVGTTDEIVYISSTTANQAATLIAVDAQLGTEKWHVDLGATKGWAAGPFAGGGTAVLDVGTRAAPVLVGVDAVTGTERWRLPGPAGYDVSLIANNADVAIVSSLGPRLRDRVADSALAGPGPERAQSCGGRRGLTTRPWPTVWWSGSRPRRLGRRRC